MVVVLAPVSRRYLSGLPTKAFVDSKCNLVDSQWEGRSIDTLPGLHSLEETMISELGTDYSMHGDAGDAKTSLVRVPIASEPAPP
jgi:hypothetical protein